MPAVVTAPYGHNEIGTFAAEYFYSGDFLPERYYRNRQKWKEF